VASTCFLNTIRFSTGKSSEAGGILDEDEDDEDDEEWGEIEEIGDVPTIDLDFQKVDLTFKDIRYTVSTSLGKEKLDLLKGVSGVIESGKMTALVRILASWVVCILCCDSSSSLPNTNHDASRWEVLEQEKQLSWMS